MRALAPSTTPIALLPDRVFMALTFLALTRRRSTGGTQRRHIRRLTILGPAMGARLTSARPNHQPGDRHSSGLAPGLGLVPLPRPRPASLAATSASEKKPIAKP